MHQTLTTKKALLQKRNQWRKPRVVTVLNSRPWAGVFVYHVTPPDSLRKVTHDENSLQNYKLNAIAIFRAVPYIKLKEEFPTSNTLPNPSHCFSPSKRLTRQVRSTTVIITRRSHRNREVENGA
jgi:hypothetical protein